MFYGLHTTTKAERDMLLAREGKKIVIDPSTFHKSHHKSMVWEEDTGQFYEHSTDDFIALLAAFDKDPNYDYKQSAYWKRWQYKAHEIHMRVARLPQLLKDIRENGIKNPVHCEVTGERLDGSYRTKIAMYLGIKEIPAILHNFTWKDIDESFIRRKIESRGLSTGKDYYEFEYGLSDLKNIADGGEVYRENAERAKYIVSLIKGDTVLDMGCNEGLISIEAARAGHVVVGVDIDLNHIAYLNRLIFEYVDQKDIPVEFMEMDIRNTTIPADTVLFLNVLYHIPRSDQEALLRKFDGKQLIFQCNLRKEAERDKYYTSHPDDLMELLHRVGRKGRLIEWRDKPIVMS